MNFTFCPNFHPASFTSLHFLPFTAHPITLFLHVLFSASLPFILTMINFKTSREESESERGKSWKEERLSMDRKVWGEKIIRLNYLAFYSHSFSLPPFENGFISWYHNSFYCHGSSTLLWCSIILLLHLDSSHIVFSLLNPKRLKCNPPGALKYFWEFHSWSLSTELNRLKSHLFYSPFICYRWIHNRRSSILLEGRWSGTSYENSSSSTFHTTNI